MAKTNQRPAVLRDSWKKTNQPPRIGRLLKSLKLVALIAAGLTLLSCFLFLTFGPVWHPNTHVLLITGGQSKSHQLEPLNYSLDDLEQFSVIKPSVARQSVELLDNYIELKSEEAVAEIKNQLDSMVLKSKDILIIYVSAHCYVLDKKPYICCSNFEFGASGVGQIPVNRFLDLVCDTNAGTKLIILESGQHWPDARAGMVTNMLPSVLESQIKGRRNLWIMGACQDYQRSLFSMKDKHTNFGYFVAQGLQGAADLDQDRIVNLQELYRYVHANVSAASELKDRKPLQTPFLFSGLEAQISSDPVLLSIDPLLVQNDTAEGQANSETPSSTTEETVTEQKLNLTPPKTQQLSSSEDQQLKDDLKTPIEVAVKDKPENLLKVSLQTSGESQKARSKIWNQTYRTSGKLLKQAWDLYFDLEESQFAHYRPIDYAPVSWRELGDLIMRYDRQIRQGHEAIETTERLTEIIEALEALKTGEPVPLAANFGVIDQIVASQPPSLFGPNEIYSMGYWQQLESTGLTKQNADLTKKIAEFDSALKSETSEPLIKWLNQNSDLARMHEFWLANKLLTTPNLDWPIQRLCLSVTRLAGRTGSPYVSQFPSILERLELADQVRIQANALLEDQVEGGWLQRAKTGLEESAKIYTQIGKNINTLNQAYHLRNDLVKRLIYLKRLGFINADKTNNTFYELMDELINAVSKLDTQLNSPAETEFSSLQSGIKTSTNIYRRVCNLLFQNSTKGNTSFAIGQVDFNTLLDAPIFETEARSALLLQLHARPKLNSIAPTIDAIPTASEFKTDPNNSSKLQYALESKILDLKANGGNEIERLKKSIKQNTFDRTETDRLLADFYEEMFEEVKQALSDQSTDETDARQLRKTWFNYQLVDHRDLPPSPKTVNTTPIYHDAGFHSLALARSRMSALVQNKTLIDRQFLVEIRNSYLLKMEQFGSIAEQKFDELRPIQFRGTKHVNLTGGQSREIEISYQLTTKEMENVRLYLDYNPKSIMVRELNNLKSAVNMIELRALRPLLVSPLDHTNSTAKKTSPGEQNKLTLLLSPLPEGPDSNLIVTAVVNGQAIRHVVNATLSAQSDWQLTLEPRMAEIAYAKDNLIDLLPLPNRKSDFELFLRNKSGRPSNVKLTLISPRKKLTATIPAGGISATKLQTFKDSLGPFLILHETPVWTSIPSNSPLPIPMLPVKEKEDADVPVEEKAPPENIDVRHGILAVLTDENSGDSQIWHLDFRPQKPMRFLNLTAGYNAARERVEIKVKSNAAETIPIEGHEVICEFVRPLSLRSQSRLQGKITPQTPEIDFYAEVASAEGRFETVNINVDNYPRAFIFEIPCWEDVQQIAPSRNITNMEISRPLPNQSFQAPTQSIPVEFKVDTPITAFDNPNSVVEIGIDADRDRELNREKTVKFYSDRQAEIGFEGLDQDGKIQIDNQVGDFRINLNGTGFRNSKVNILGRIQTDSKTVWSNPVEIRLDAKPPEIKRLILDPGNVITRESKFFARVLAEDGAMSGVESVKIQFANSDGELNEELPTVLATKQSDLSWLGEIPLDDLPDGSNELLISAVDGVGNQSQYSKKLFKITTPEKMAEEKQRQRFTLKGKVYYRGTTKAGAKVELVNEEGQTLEATCDENGTFKFEQLPSGQYSLKAKAVVRNKPRIFKDQIEFGPDQPSMKSLAIDLD
ncbi:hypothetical protein N9B60_00495 [Mariniblastus sp.]|nr:hypothetical protein [Mariniblastus sp.]